MGNRRPVGKQYLEWIHRRTRAMAGGPHSMGKKPYAVGATNYIDTEHYDQNFPPHRNPRDPVYPPLPPIDGPPPTGVWPPIIPPTDLNCGGCLIGNVTELGDGYWKFEAWGVLPVSWWLEPLGCSSPISLKPSEKEVPAGSGCGFSTLVVNESDYCCADNYVSGLTAWLVHITDARGCKDTAWAFADTCDTTPTITCDGGACDEITTNSIKQYYLNDSTGIASWAVTGKGASISATGLLTTTSAACGSLTVTATDSCCGVYTQVVRVTNAGGWEEVARFSQCETGFNCLNFGTSCGDCVEISGGIRTTYFYRCRDGAGAGCVSTGQNCDDHACSGTESQPDHGWEYRWWVSYKIDEWVCP